MPVYKVADLTKEGPHIARELALIKVISTGTERSESLRIADAFRARVVDATVGSFVFEMTGGTQKIDAFIALIAAGLGRLMRPLGLAERRVAQPGGGDLIAAARCKVTICNIFQLKQADEVLQRTPLKIMILVCLTESVPK